MYACMRGNNQTCTLLEKKEQHDKQSDKKQFCNVSCQHNTTIRPQECLTIFIHLQSIYESQTKKKTMRTHLNDLDRFHLVNLRPDRLDARVGNLRVRMAARGVNVEKTSRLLHLHPGVYEELRPNSKVTEPATSCRAFKPLEREVTLTAGREVARRRR